MITTLLASTAVCKPATYAITGHCSIWIITLAALVDSINPCAIAVLLILLGTIINSQKSKQVVLVGLAFILGLYVTYFLFGIGFFSALSFANLGPLFHKIIGSLAILVGLFNIKDFFWYGKGFLMEIPRAWRPRMQKFLQGVANPYGAFIIGALVTLFELPCTGGPYLFAIGYMSDKATHIQAYLILLYYNLIFVLPLLIIVGLLFFGYNVVDKTMQLKNKNIRLLHLIAGLILVGLGIWVFLQ